MTPKEVLEHDWKVGEKVYVVWHVYDFRVNDKNCLRPCGVMETTVVDTIVDVYPSGSGIYKKILLDKSDFTSDRIPESDSFISALVHYEWLYGKRNPENDNYYHRKFCVDKFLTRKDAEKRYKQSVKTWNKAIDREIERRKSSVKSTKRMYNSAKKSASKDIRGLKIE